MELKITKHIIDHNRGGQTINYYCNKVLVAVAECYSDWFCTIKKGTPSNIRDKVKKCKKFDWEREGLIKVIGHSDFTVGCRYTRSFNHINPDFMNTYPDTTWGDRGHIPSMQAIKEAIEAKCKK